MEALRNDTIHTPDSISPLSHINTSPIEEISKEKEEELLYGGDDGDEEDVLSDDSIRLRLSDEDDDIIEDNIPVLNNQQKSDHVENEEKFEEKIEEKTEESKNVEASATPGEDATENASIEKEEKQEESGPGNTVTNDNIVTHENNVTKNERGSVNLPAANMSRSPQQNYDPQWRFPRSGHNYSFRTGNHISYTRFRYILPRGQYRHKPQNYNNNRSNNSFIPYERGRGNGKYNSYNRSIYNDRQQKKTYRSANIKKSNTSHEHDQSSMLSSSDADVSLIAASDDNAKNTNTNDNEKTEGSNECSDTNQENSTVCKVTQKDVNVTKTEELKKECSETEKETATEQTDVTSLKNVDESKNVTAETNSFDDPCSKGTNSSDDSRSKEIANASVNVHDSNKETGKDDNIRTNNENDSNNFNSSDNSKKVDTLLNEDVDCNSSKHDVTDHSKRADVKNEDKNGATNTATDVDINNSELEIEPNQTIEVVGINELIVNEEIKDSKEKEVSINDQSNVPVQSLALSEDKEHDTPNENISTLRDLLLNNSDNKITIVKSHVLCDLLFDKDSCDKKLNNSDNSTNSNETNKLLTSKDGLADENVVQGQNETIIKENVQSINNDSSMINSIGQVSEVKENSEPLLNENSSSSEKPENDLSDSVPSTKDNNGDSDKKVVEVSTHRRRRRTKKMIVAALEADKQVREGGRQKRRTAKNAEEIIRKKFLNTDSDLESSDSSEKFVIVNHKVNQDARSLSPPSLKRNHSDTDSASINGSVKKLKLRPETPSDATKENKAQNVKNLDYVHKFFQRGLQEKLPKLKQEELEELLIQKIVETITMRGEIGKLREQARISERNQEVTRQKCQQLAKQIKDFEMVLSRNAADRRANNDKPIPPIKINRSVGLQVNFVTDHGIQNLRQLQQMSNIKSLNISNGNNSLNTSSNEGNNTSNNAASPRRGLKVRSPRRAEPLSGQSVVVSQSHTQSPAVMASITPAALVVTKAVDAQHNLPITNQPNVQQVLPNQQSQTQLSPQVLQQAQQTIIFNGSFSNPISCQSTTMNVSQQKTNDLIDLTDEEEKNKVTTTTSIVSTTLTDQQMNLAQKAQQPCFQRVIQTIPGNVAITSQPPSLRVVQPASQPTPTALVNNMSAPRLTYVMQSGVGPARQLLIAPNNTTIRPVTSNNRTSFSTVTYKTGISTVANGTVRVLTTPATSNVQVHQHPAPLPDTRAYTINPLMKLPPPAPSLKISKVANGIVLSWNMNLTDKYAEIASYQLYAYQEVAGIPPSTSLWKKVGDVRALPLPMACTLTQFSEGNNYYFAIRAVDTHSRKGQYSIPGNISL